MNNNELLTALGVDHIERKERAGIRREYWQRKIICDSDKIVFRSIHLSSRKKERKKEMAAAPDHLFNLRNNFYLGSYQAAINSSDLPNLSPDDAVERDCLVYRSYIALGSYQVPFFYFILFLLSKQFTNSNSTFFFSQISAGDQWDRRLRCYSSPSC